MPGRDIGGFHLDIHLTLLFDAGKNSQSERKIGYVNGGYRTVFNSTCLKRSLGCGGNIVTDAPVDSLLTTQTTAMELATPRGRFHFDQVIATIPSRRFLLMAPQLATEYARKLSEVKYLGVVCFVLLLKRRLSPYYVLNLTEENLPFTGVIEMTNLVSLSETAGYHLVYLPKYTVPGDPAVQCAGKRVVGKLPGRTSTSMPGPAGLRDRSAASVPRASGAANSCP